MAVFLFDKAENFSKLGRILGKQLTVCWSWNNFTFPQAVLEGGFIVNKNDLIASVAEAAGLSKADAGKAVDGVFNAISGALSGGDEVRLVGFGTFSVANRAATTGRNPRTGEAIQIPASKQPKFKAGKALKDAVNG